MGGREETNDESETLHLLGGNNLGFFLISLNRGTAAMYTIFSPSYQQPQRGRKPWRHTGKGIDMGIAVLTDPLA